LISFKPCQIPSTESLQVPTIPGTGIPPCGHIGLKVQKGGSA
jgi:hypothetical protein